MISIGTAIADMWTKIGVKVTIKHYEWGAFPPMQIGDQPNLTGWASMFRTAGRPDAPWRYNTAFGQDSTERMLGDKDNCHETCKRFVDLYKAVVNECDPGKRTALNDSMVEFIAATPRPAPVRVQLRESNQLLEAIALRLISRSIGANLRRAWTGLHRLLATGVVITCTEALDLPSRFVAPGDRGSPRGGWTTMLPGPQRMRLAGPARSKYSHQLTF